MRLWHVSPVWGSQVSGRGGSTAELCKLCEPNSPLATIHVERVPTTRPRAVLIK